MLVFIDESGDPGFKLDKGSSPIFVTSMVIFENAQDAAHATNCILKLKQDMRVNPEFKFSKCKDSYRDGFFNGVSGCKFQTRSVVVQKHKIYSPALRTVKESFYKFFIRMMMQHDGGNLTNAKVVIDGSGDRSFKRQFKSYLRRNTDSGAIKQFDLKDSVNDPLIQLADMTAGCIARSYRQDRGNPHRWRDLLNNNGQLQNVWEFE